MTVVVPHVPLPVDQTDVRYAHGPDSSRQAGVPAGETTEVVWDHSDAYPGTTRKLWVHVPVGCGLDEPAGLLVFQDGWWNLDPTGEVRAGVVLDNLVHRGEIPPTIGLFVDPGVFPEAVHPRNRNAEYDAFDDRYVEFLLTEIVPQVSGRHRLSDDPSHWAVCGGSSGGNCAFTAAWLRPDRFGNALCLLSSFAQMPAATLTPG